MTQNLDAALLRYPSEEELAAAVSALHRQTKERGSLCGCYVALCRDPFYAGLVAHWRTYHPASLAILQRAQANRLRA